MKKILLSLIFLTISFGLFAYGPEGAKITIISSGSTYLKYNEASVSFDWTSSYNGTIATSTIANEIKNDMISRYGSTPSVQVIMTNSQPKAQKGILLIVFGPNFESTKNYSIRVGYSTSLSVTHSEFGNMGMSSSGSLEGGDALVYVADSNPLGTYTLMCDGELSEINYTVKAINGKNACCFEIVEPGQYTVMGKLNDRGPIQSDPVQIKGYAIFSLSLLDGGTITSFVRVYDSQTIVQVSHLREGSGHYGVEGYQWERKTKNSDWASLAAETTYPNSCGVNVGNDDYVIVRRKVRSRDKVAYSNPCMVFKFTSPPDGNNQNYIHKTVYDHTASDIAESMTYYDGLGRAVQNIDISGGGQISGRNSTADIITHIEYDAMGRDNARVYLPYPSEESAGNFVKNARSPQLNYYKRISDGNETAPYLSNIFEMSTLGRVKQSFEPGKVFRENGKFTRYDYSSNLSPEVVYKFSHIDTNGAYVVGKYSNHSLYKTTNTDADGNVSVTFRDSYDKVILERNLCDDSDRTVNVDTYYVYDNLDRLVCVVPPEASVRVRMISETSGILDETHIGSYCYLYKYDERGRVIEKKMPGKEVEYFIYDKGDRLIMSQDGNLRRNGRWTYTVYDNLNRPANQNIVETNLNYEEVKAAFASSSFPPTYPKEHYRLSVPFPNYNNTRWSRIGVISETRYGNYVYMLSPYQSVADHVPENLKFVTVPGVVSEADRDNNTSGLKIYEKIGITDGEEMVLNNFVERAFYYDNKGRVIQTVEKNHLGGISRYSNNYDFGGKVLTNLEQHSETGMNPEPELVIPEDYEPLMLGTYLSFYPGAGRQPVIVDPEGKYFTSSTTVHEKYLICKPPYPSPSTPPFYYHYIPEDCMEIVQNTIAASTGSSLKLITAFPGEGTPLSYIGTAPYYHIPPSEGTDSKLTQFAYDHRGRVLSEKTTLNDGEEAVVHYGYDELGRLVSKRYGDGIVDTREQLLVGKYLRYSIGNGGGQVVVDPEKKYFGDSNLPHSKYYICGKTGNQNTNDYYYIPEDCLGIVENTIAASAIWAGYALTTDFPLDSQPLTCLGGLEEGGSVSTETYDYNIQGWLTEQSSPYFDMRLRYYDPQKGGDASYTGNIAEWEWEHREPGTANPTRNTYAFTYDRLSRLTDTDHYAGDATTPVNSFVEREIKYDKNGNIKKLKRYSGGHLVDNLTYDYTGNRLTSLMEVVAAPAAGWDVYDRGASSRLSCSYSYDANGNMTGDERKGLDFRYNFLNLLSEARDSSTGTLITKYTFLADGQKVSAVNGDGSFGLAYLGSLVYRRDAVGGLTLESTGFGGGRILAVETGTGYDYTPNYFLTDHLGSTRVVLDSGGVSERNDFYAFGARHKTPHAAITDNRYRFSGKEDQESLGLPFQDFGARMYDAPLGRWWSPDPLAEDYYSSTPFNYVDNDPISHVDPDGTFKTRFGAWLYKVFNGGGNVYKDKGGEYFVSQNTTQQYNGGDVTVSARRVFDRNGRTEGRDLELEALIEARRDMLELQMMYDRIGIEYYYTDDYNEARNSWISLATIGILPTAVTKGAAIASNSAKAGNVAAKGGANVLGKTISAQKQARHIAGTAKQGGGFLNSAADAQAVLNAVHSGDATFLGVSKAGHQVYRFNGVTGTNVNLGAGITGQPTNIFIIKGTVHPTVVPTSPFWKL